MLDDPHQVVVRVLVADRGRWRFELFSGPQAAVLTPLRLVGG
ncbi:hypothetical protein [Nocardioides deserti]|nr:hypothetical protein [Nocardioides deserti]